MKIYRFTCFHFYFYCVTYIYFYSIQVANVLDLWIATKQFPIEFQNFDLLQPTTPLCDIVTKNSDEAVACLSVALENDDATLILGELDKLLTRDLIWTMLRLRITTGTRVGLLPPSWLQCWRAFNLPHCGKGELTVGARALTKHWQRSTVRMAHCFYRCNNVQHKHSPFRNVFGLLKLK